MKIRKGFVSNSSSSSFILAISKGSVCEHCGRKDISIDKLEYLIESKNNHGNDYSFLSNENDIKEELNWWNDLDIETFKDQLKENEQLIYIDFEMHDEIIREYIENEPNVRVLYSVEG